MEQVQRVDAAPPRPPFKVSGTASIKHLNVRKEGPEDDKILACDLKLEIKNVDRRLCGYFDEALETFLWRGETDALIARNAFLAPVAYGNEVTSANVRIGSNSFVGCDVKKFAIEPRDGGVITLTCSVSVYPSTNDVSDLAKLVQDEASVSIEGPPDLFAAGPDSSEVAGAVDAFRKLDETLKKDGISATISTSTGEVLATLGKDELYAQAEALVRKENRASASLVQRTLKIGYNRAAQILEQLQDGGVVSPMDATGKRHVHKTTPGEKQ
jgi:hypothetical protein